MPRVFLCCMLIFGMAIVACGEKNDENKQDASSDSAAMAGDAEAILGSWKPVKAELAGKPMPDAAFQSIRLKLDQTNYEAIAGGKPDRGTYVLDATTTPRSMTITGTEGPNLGKSIPAIYELKTDTLRICYNLAGENRPSDFSSIAGTQLLLVTYIRLNESEGD